MKISATVIAAIIIVIGLARAVINLQSAQLNLMTAEIKYANMNRESKIVGMQKGGRRWIKSKIVSALLILVIVAVFLSGSALTTVGLGLIVLCVLSLPVVIFVPFFNSILDMIQTITDASARHAGITDKLIKMNERK